MDNILRPPNSYQSINTGHPRMGDETTDLGGVEHDRRETRRHLTVQPDLDASLDLVLRLNQRI